MSEELSSKKREEQLAERKLLIELEHESIRSFDKAMLTLSGGALGLSIAFIRQIAPLPKSKCLLSIAWISLILALTVTSLSFLFSSEAMSRQRELNEKPNQEQPNPWNRWITVLNYFSIGFFIFGMIFLVLFSILNLP